MGKCKRKKECTLSAICMWSAQRVRIIFITWYNSTIRITRPIGPAPSSEAASSHTVPLARRTSPDKVGQRSGARVDLEFRYTDILCVVRIITMRVRIFGVEFWRRETAISVNWHIRGPVELISCYATANWRSGEVSVSRDRDSYKPTRTRPLLSDVLVL